jgi:carbon starvation protein
MEGRAAATGHSRRPGPAFHERKIHVNVMVPLLVALPVFVVAHRFFARYLQRALSGGREEPAPSVTLRDGVDYVPTKTPVVFSHHFASIAGAGPIVGPTVAMIYGFLPVWLWVVVGAVFIGAVQDYTALFVSMRERGQSMARVAEKTLGRAGFLMVMIFAVIMLLLLTSAFLGLSTTALTSLVPLNQMRVAPEDAILHVVRGADGVVCAKVGGVASTSLVLITLCAPVIGWLVIRRKASLAWILPVALFVCLVSVVIGIRMPLALSPGIWMVSLSLYVVVASGLPVWLILQPRDFINSFMLYAGMAVLVAGVLAGSLGGVSMQMPALNLAEGNRTGGLVWPFLFITVACGAISGFHAMVSGGTTSKQVETEVAARGVGYGGMLLEAVLAILVVSAVGVGLNLEDYKALVYPKTSVGVGSNPVLAFALGMSGLLHQGLSIPMEYGTVFGMLMVEGFIVTTLDTAVRLNRYLFDEIWSALIPNPPRWLRHPLFNAGLASGLMLLLCVTNSFRYIWHIFGSANQLMAALALLVVAMWLMARSRPSWFVVWPALFMLTTTIVSLVMLLFNKYLPERKYPLVVTAVLLLLLAAGVIALALRQVRILARRPDPA